MLTTAVIDLSWARKATAAPAKPQDTVRARNKKRHNHQLKQQILHVASVLLVLAHACGYSSGWPFEHVVGAACAPMLLVITMITTALFSHPWLCPKPLNHDLHKTENACLWKCGRSRTCPGRQQFMANLWGNRE